MAPESGLSAEQLAACMPAHDKWPWRAEQDGWMQAHNALRLDMSDFHAVLTVLTAQEAAGKPITAWQAREALRMGKEARVER